MGNGGMLDGDRERQEESRGRQDERRVERSGESRGNRAQEALAESVGTDLLRDSQNQSRCWCCGVDVVGEMERETRGQKRALGSRRVIGCVLVPSAGATLWPLNAAGAINHGTSHALLACSQRILSPHRMPREGSQSLRRPVPVAMTCSCREAGRLRCHPPLHDQTPRTASFMPDAHRPSTRRVCSTASSARCQAMIRVLRAAARPSQVHCLTSIVSWLGCHRHCRVLRLYTVS